MTWNVSFVFFFCCAHMWILDLCRSELKLGDWSLSKIEHRNFLRFGPISKCLFFRQCLIYQCIVTS